MIDLRLSFAAMKTPKSIPVIVHKTCCGLTFIQDKNNILVIRIPLHHLVLIHDLKFGHSK